MSDHDRVIVRYLFADIKFKEIIREIRILIVHKLKARRKTCKYSVCFFDGKGNSSGGGNMQTCEGIIVLIIKAESYEKNSMFFGYGSRSDCSASRKLDPSESNGLFA
jgi:hypothetical protein